MYLTHRRTCTLHESYIYSQAILDVIRSLHATHQGCLLIVLGDVCICMESKHLWVGGDWEALHVVHVALVLAVHRGIVHTTWGEPAWVGVEQQRWEGLPLAGGRSAR